jgi:hypothetical protein
VYGARIRQAVSVNPHSIGVLDPTAIKEFNINVCETEPEEIDISDTITKYNRETCLLIKQKEDRQSDSMEIPANVYWEAKVRIKELMMTVNQLQASMGANPKLQGFIPEHLKLENIDPLLVWIHENTETKGDENMKQPTSAVARMPTEEATTTPEVRVKVKPVPNIQRQNSGSDVEVIEDTKPAATESQQPVNLGIGKGLPQCQNVNQIAEAIRESKFGDLKLLPQKEDEPEEIKDLTDLEVIVAYSTFLLMIVGRLTTSNVKMDVEHDWYATNINHRTTFINGFYGAWYNIEKTWDPKTIAKFRGEETENGFVAALGSLRACTIGVNDEIFLKAMNNGGKIDRKMYYQFVGHPKVKKVDDEVRKIIKAPHIFEEAENGGGRLYDPVVRFIHNADRTGRLRVATRQVQVDMSDIQSETNRRATGGNNKKRRPPNTTILTPSKRPTYSAGRETRSDSDSSYEDSEDNDDDDDAKPEENLKAKFDSEQNTFSL